MAGKPLTLAVLGGGSFYTPSFIGTMCRRPDVFAGTEVRLQDPNAERVRLVKEFCEVYVRAKGVEMSFLAQADLDRALEGADFVIATFRIGGPASLVLDESIPPRFGYFGNETVGPGGMFMAARTAPVVLDVAARMRRLCPGGWLLNYANPTNFIADALRRSGFDRTVGLCDGFICPPRDIGATLGVDFQTIRTRHAGVNHCSWAYRADCGGRDLMEELRRIDDAAARRNLSALDAHAVERRLRWLEIFRVMGLYPAPAGHLEAYFYHDEFLQRQTQGNRDYHTFRGERDRENWDRLKAVLHQFDLAQAEQVARTHYGGHADLAIGVAAALATDSGEVYPVNVPHRGAVQGIAPQTVLEVYCEVSGHGFAPIDVPPFPPAVLAQQAHLAAVQQIAVDGILHKDRGKLFQALCLHPFTTSVARARTLFEAMWQEEGHLLEPYWKA